MGIEETDTSCKERREGSGRERGEQRRGQVSAELRMTVRAAQCS